MATPTGSRLPVRLSAALWAERRVPVLARALRPSPVLPGTTAPHGTVYRGADGGPLLVLAGDAGAAPQWLGSALATAVGAVAFVLPDDRPEAALAGTDPENSSDGLPERIAAAVAAGPSLGADPERVALVAVGNAVAAALAAVAADAGSRVRRLVLLVPTSAPGLDRDLDLGAVPPTFLQSSPQSPALAVSRSLEIDLREAGVAVRPVEYAGLPDAWVRYPRFAPGSRRAVEDLVAFLRRGFGLDGTFPGVIPGWDLK